MYSNGSLVLVPMTPVKYYVAQILFLDTILSSCRLYAKICRKLDGYIQPIPLTEDIIESNPDIDKICSNETETKYLVRKSGKDLNDIWMTFNKLDGILYVNQEILYPGRVAVELRYLHELHDMLDCWSKTTGEKIITWWVPFGIEPFEDSISSLYVLTDE